MEMRVVLFGGFHGLVLWLVRLEVVVEVTFSSC